MKERSLCLNTNDDSNTFAFSNKISNNHNNRESQINEKVHQSSKNKHNNRSLNSNTNHNLQNTNQNPNITDFYRKGSHSPLGSPNRQLLTQSPDSLNKNRHFSNINNYRNGSKNASKQLNLQHNPYENQR